MSDQPLDDSTQVVRKRSTPAPPRSNDTPLPGRRSGIRVWPPKPSSASITLPDFALDSDSVTETEIKAHAHIPDAIPIEYLCIHCETKLIDPDGVGLCPKCNWCRSISEGCNKLTAVETQAFLDKPRPEKQRTWSLGPPWIWGLLGGCLLILVTASIVNLSMPHHCRERTIWSTYQLIFGIAFMLMGQWWLILKLGTDSDLVGPMDLIVISGRLWSHAFKQMPRTLGPVFMCCWGLLIAITAVTITGGLSDWISDPQPIWKLN